MGLPNEDKIKRILSSRRMVDWYNGSLDSDIDYEQDLNLKNCEDVAIIGNGNVAIDIARILSKDVNELKLYDMPLPALDQLS